MKWTELKIITASEAVEAVANILMDAGAAGVAIEDALDLQNFAGDEFGEILDKQNFDHIKEGAAVMAYFPDSVFMPEILPTVQSRVAELQKFHLDIGKNEISTKEVLEEDWATAWKKYYHPVRLTRYLTVVPEWESYTPVQADEKLIRLDPGMAFGTGTHPTTQLTLQAMEAYIRGGETMLDVGTGSGVLSIAGKYLGAAKVYAYDLDQVAVKSAVANLNLNPIAADVTVEANNLLQGVTQQADLIVANILADIILQLLPDAARLLKVQGKLILSGIISDKRSEIIDRALAQELELCEQLQIKDWVCLVFQKPEKE